MAEDRRVRRTKRLLRAAVVELILDRGYEPITIDEISEKADVGRATFYKHYADKQDLLDHIAVDLQAELAERLSTASLETTPGFTGVALLELFQHARANRDAYRVILRGEGNGTALRRFVDEQATNAAKVFTQRASNLGVTPRMDIDLLARAWVGEQVAVLQWWIEQDAPTITAEQLAHDLLNLSLNGRYWASGFDTPPSDDT